MGESQMGDVYKLDGRYFERKKQKREIERRTDRDKERGRGRYR